MFFTNVYSVVEVNIVYLTESEEELCELVILKQGIPSKKILKQGTARKTTLLVGWLRIWWLYDWFIYSLIS